MDRSPVVSKTSHFIFSKSFKRCVIVFFLFVCAVGCGSGGSSNSVSDNGDAGEEARLEWQQGVYPNSELFMSQCETPRNGIDPLSGRFYQDSLGSLLHESFYLRSFVNEFYLWYDEVEDRNPRDFATPQEYFDVLKTFEETPSGQEKDEFHWSMDTADYIKQFEQNIFAGFGVNFVSQRDGQGLLRVLVAFVQEGSVGDLAGLKRGMRVIEANGVNFENELSDSDIDKVNEVLFRPSVGQQYSFKMQTSNGEQDFDLIAEDVAMEPVQKVAVIESELNRKVGYIQFNDHVSSAEQPLIQAFADFNENNVEELILDLRYNSGGELDLAARLAYMVAGAAQSREKIFNQQQFNDKWGINDPFTGLASNTPFFSFSSNLRPLPSVNLNRVFVITTDDTCSASETIINGLRGIDVDVIQIGGKTCGKPYGFYPEPNCGTTYFTVQFRGVNHKGFGDYEVGFAPANANEAFAIEIPGCFVEDDLTREWGDKEEAMLAEALRWIDSQTCSEQSELSAQKTLEKRFYKTSFVENDQQTKRLIPSKRIPGVIKTF